MAEFIDHRYLGALKCVDRATGFHLNRALSVSGQDLSFLRNRSYLYIIKEASGLEQHSVAFAEPQATPPLATLPFNVRISDPLNQYLPRTIQIALPRDTDPANSSSADSVFNPLDVRLYAAPNASVMANWSTVRVSVMQQHPGADDIPVAGSLLRVIRNSDDQVLSSGISDLRGEALVIIPGIPITQFADDEEDDGPGGGPGGGHGGGPGGPGAPSPVVVSEISARLEVSVAAGTEWPTNPDLLEVNHLANLVATEALTLRTGRMEKVTVQLT